MDAPMTLQGFPVVVSNLLHDTSKLKVSDFVPMTYEARYSMNDWLLDMFGVQQTVLFDGGTFYMSPKYYTQLKMMKGE